MTTRTGVVRQLYAARVEAQPFSRFTADPDQRKANAAWRERAQAWGDARVDEHGKLKPVDPELFKRTAPQWNCVDFPGDGMHYVDNDGSCFWCGMTRERIAAERATKGE